MKVKMTISKRERDLIRSEMSDSTQTASLIRESQFEKAELRRLKLSWEERIGEIRERLDLQLAEITGLKTKRSVMSDTLQKWIFEQYIVYNASGGKTSVWELFSGQGLIPPGGTGDCAAPKLLNHAYRMGLLPLAMGEFWYGKNTDTAVRCHGHFYPSCTSKCGPLLSYMLKGLTFPEGWSFMERDDVEQAKATFESIRDGYSPSGEEDDVLDNVNMRLKRIEESTVKQ